MHFFATPSSLVRRLPGLMAVLVAVSLALVPATAAAAAKKKRGGPITKDWDEVERGLYVTGNFGGGILLGAPGDAPGALMGLSFGVAAGFDLGDRLELEGYLSGVQVGAPSSYRGEASGAIAPGGDFATLLMGARVRYGYLGISDSQGIERFYLTVSAGGGVLTSAPASQLGGLQPQAFGGLGFRYYTRMRHFSIGLDLEAAYGLGTSTLVLHPQLGLAYTF
ncbi:MAG: adventurous gliding motility protein CglE [Deltaproteobacteria bacterium]|nr:adventurous gliding motility protein CglE [Deltaproteobacteria bacterium]